jgi:hypothetical protein
MSNERLHAIELAQQQQLKEQRPYYWWMGFPLHSSEPEASLGEDPHSEVTCIFIFRTSYAKNT